MMRRVLCISVLIIVCSAANVLAATDADNSVPRFLNDIAPILDTNGCSTALCHGKFGGQGGFDLSLLTLDPEADYHPIVTASRGRRVNLIEPERSLLLLKLPSRWATRVECVLASIPRIISRYCVGWRLAPHFRHRIRASERLEGASRRIRAAGGWGESATLKVLAYFTDGTVEDVTHKTVYESNDEPIAEVHEGGLVTSMRWEARRFLRVSWDKSPPAFVTIPRESEMEEYPEFPPNNFIDTFVGAKLKKLNVTPSALSSDEEFIRRVYLDTIAKLPDTR